MVHGKVLTPCLHIDNITYYVRDENGQLSISDTTDIINLEAHYYWKKY